MTAVPKDRLNWLFETHHRKPKERYLDAVLDLESRGVITIEEVTYTPGGDLRWFLPGSENEDPRETSQHQRLKRNVAAYLKETGCNSVRIEVETWFGKADVGCITENRYAECGAVRVEKFLQAFGKSANLDFLGESNPQFDTVNELLYVPYTTNKTQPTTMLSFKPGDP